MTPTPEDHEAAARKVLADCFPTATGAYVKADDGSMWALEGDALPILVKAIAAALAEAVRVAVEKEREACAMLHENVDPACDHEIQGGHPGAGAFAAIIQYRDAIRARSEAEAPRIEDALRMRVGPSEAQATPAPGRCPHCSFSPESASDYCDEHRPKGWGTPPETKERG